MTKTTIRKARKDHVCDSGWGALEAHPIYRGQLYAHHVCSPNDPEIGNERWWTMKECARCHERRTGVTLEAKAS